MAMKIRVWDENGYSINWNYSFFQIYNKDNRYALSTSVNSGSGDDSYSAFYYEGESEMFFTTYDYHSGSDCGYRRQSGWWYFFDHCAYANPNGRHQPSGQCGIDSEGERLVWHTSSGYHIFTHSEMKIRPQSCPLQ